MSFSSIEQATESIVDDWELERAWEALRHAHQELTYFHRRRNFAEEKILDARIELSEAVKRVQSLLLSLAATSVPKLQEAPTYHLVPVDGSLPILNAGKD